MNENDELIQKAKLGDTEAQCKLANRYLTMYYMMLAMNGGKSSVNIEEYYCQAVYWFKRAAEAGHYAAQFNLAECYYKGLGVKQNYQEAVYWYKNSAEAGFAEAQYKLALCYGVGKGVEPNDYISFRWAEKAANQGNAGAQGLIAMYYLEGIYVERDTVKAIKLLRLAYENGDEEIKSATKEVLNDLGIDV